MRYAPRSAHFVARAVPIALLIAATGAAHAQESGFIPLFDGSSLSGWEGDFTMFRIEDGSIVGGRLDERIPANTFLCTIDEFGDFELRLEASIEGRGDNGGVQFRSRRVPNHYEVSGYQADMGTVSAAWFNDVIGGAAQEFADGARSPVWGSLYDEARRNRYIAWAVPEDVTPILNDGWNAMAVRAEGPRVRIWVNGRKTVDFVEREHVPRTGSVCLQIHGGAPAEVSHRNIRIKQLPESRVSFDKFVLDEVFYSEGANFGDLNNDGVNDVVSGPFWYAGPDFLERHAYYDPNPFDPAGYSDNFFAHVLDFNADGRNDILIVGFPGQNATWYENPGTAGSTLPHWRAHVVYDSVDNESPLWTDLTSDGRPEMVFISGGRYGYAGPDWDRPEQPWVFHPISEDGGWQRFTHGLGVGDVNNDGRMDLLDRDGWWEQPASLDGDPIWTRHDVRFSERGGGAQMLVYDVNGDGDNDVITSLAAHGYGLAWFENVGGDAPSSSAEILGAGSIRFVRHLIMDDEPAENPYGLAFAELHALALADVDGDGVEDLVTGKRWWSHGAEGDPDINPRAWLYWFRIARTERGVEFVPHLIDDDTGVGVQVVAGDVDGDGLTDVVVGNKKGTRVLLQRPAR